jgi:3-hydroxybutyrate dehydrogenase
VKGAHDEDKWSDASCLSFFLPPRKRHCTADPRDAIAGLNQQEYAMILKGKTALITGSTSGIGAACATALAREGCAVMINGFGDAASIEAQRQALEELSGAKALWSGADMTQPDQIAAMVETCHAELGGPDILINNAGVQHVAPVDEFPIEKWDQLIALLLSAPFHAMRAALPYMKAKGWGRIISTASAHSMVASPNKSAYNAAKHGLVGLTKTAALEVAKQGITVNCISPGYVWTPLVENQIPDTMRTRNMTREQVINDVLLGAIPQKQFVMPDQIGAMALFLCRDEASAVTGSNLVVDGGWTAQ